MLSVFSTFLSGAPSDASTSSTGAVLAQQDDDWSSGLAAARTANKPALFRFNGPDGSACPLMEAAVFGNTEVKELIRSSFVEVGLPVLSRDAKESSARTERNLKIERERFKREAIPFFVIVSPDDKELARFEEGCTDDPHKFIDFLKRGLPARTASFDPYAFSHEQLRGKNSKNPAEKKF